LQVPWRISLSQLRVVVAVRKHACRAGRGSRRHQFGAAQCNAQHDELGTAPVHNHSERGNLREVTPGRIWRWFQSSSKPFGARRVLQRQMAAEPRVLMTPPATGWLRAAVCLVVLIAMLATAALAGAKGPVVWGGATQVDSSPITALACPAASLCVGVDGAGNVLSSTNPEGSAESWRTANIDTPNALSDVSCPSLSLCVAVDGAGNAATSTDPAGGRAAWTIDRIDPSINDPNSFSFEPNLLQGVSCPVVSLCVAVDDVTGVWR
jgi:hypothetical protein